MRPVGTYSIVARDAQSVGVAVQSHWYNVGAVVPWVDAAWGAVAVQSFSGPEPGYRALAGLRAGTSPAQILQELLEDDVQRAGGQIAIMDASGTFATHTGAGCIPCAGHHVGSDYSVQANLMDTDAVWGAMATAFEHAEGDLEERLLAALEAAEVAGGDVRGRQSAAIVVASPGPPAPLDRTFDLRVEDHPDPVPELRRLVRLRRAYIQLNDGDQLLARQDVAGALAAYEASIRTAGAGTADGEPEFWTGIALASSDRVGDAEEYLRRAAALSDRWARLVPRLVAPGMLADDPELIEVLVRAATPQQPTGSAAATE
jgi:uncharacterized Ntn-hydrolase superfamily protein